MLTLLYLIIGHLIGDSLFSKWLRDAKRRSIIFLGVHSAVYSIVVMLFLYNFMIDAFTFWKGSVFFGSHFIIDYWKCYIAKIDGNINARNLCYTFVDQILHLTVLIGTVFI